MPLLSLSASSIRVSVYNPMRWIPGICKTREQKNRGFTRKDLARFLSRWSGSKALKLRYEPEAYWTFPARRKDAAKARKLFYFLTLAIFPINLCT
jgi:hypothetical protein